MRKRKSNQIILRIDDTTKRRWATTASQSGLTLSEWIRIRCEGGLIVQSANAPAKAA